MKNICVSDIVEKINAKVLTGSNNLSRNITGGYCSDLLSDVIGNSKEGYIWITIQIHKNIIAVATLKELSAIVLTKNRRPEEDTIEIANKENIVILVSPLTSFECAGIIYNLLN